RPPEPSCSHDVLKSPLRQRYGAFAPKTALLNEEIFDTLDDARRKLALWRYDYNTVRPHSSLGNQTPLEARRTLEQFESSAPGALAQNHRPDYQSQTRRPSL
ncbi:transposase, partial [Paracoccus yeei]|uniref:transposase n=2 Tax=Paracoccus yeei TaxID=147645 RepID=UPI00200A4F8E